MGGEAPRGGRSQPPAPARRARKMAAAGRAWRTALLLSPWRLRAPCRAYGAAAGVGGGCGGRRLLLSAAFALGGGTGLYLAAQHRLREHSAAEVTRRRARSVPEAGLASPPPRCLASRPAPKLYPLYPLPLPPRLPRGQGLAAGSLPGPGGDTFRGARSGFCRL